MRHAKAQFNEAIKPTSSTVNGAIGRRGLLLSLGGTRMVSSFRRKCRRGPDQPNPILQTALASQVWCTIAWQEFAA
jgi:hypothetical protein